MLITLTDKQVDAGPRHSQLRRYFHTARERHLIYRRRVLDKASPPWTTDPIMSRYRFCNVYRELDRVTIWLRREWREPYADHRNLAFSMALARMINWPPTLEEIGFPVVWKPNRTINIIRRRQARGEKIYTSAYLLGAIPKGAVKARYLVNDVLTPLYEELPEAIEEFEDSLEVAWNWFKSHRGIGDFLAYEIVSDLRYTRYLSSARDAKTWANAGPGALRGLTRLWGYQPKVARTEGDYYIFPRHRAQEAMQMLVSESNTHFLEDTVAWEMREAEHWLCEFDKYERIRHGQGMLERFTSKPEVEW